MQKWKARSLHRRHTRLTKQLVRAYAYLERAEANETLGPGLYYAHIAKSKKRIDSLIEELKRYEDEHPEL